MRKSLEEPLPPREGPAPNWYPEREEWYLVEDQPGFPWVGPLEDPGDPFYLCRPESEQANGFCKLLSGPAAVELARRWGLRIVDFEQHGVPDKMQKTSSPSSSPPHPAAPSEGDAERGFSSSSSRARPETSSSASSVSASSPAQDLQDEHSGSSSDPNYLPRWLRRGQKLLQLNADEPDSDHEESCSVRAVASRKSPSSASGPRKSPEIRVCIIDIDAHGYDVDNYKQNSSPN